MSENPEKRIDPKDQLGISRRRLVKSALVAAPVVLTLRSGAALANASAYQCIQRDQARADAGANPLRTPDEPSDDWERRTVDVKRLKDNQNNEFLVYEDPDSDNWFTEEGDPVVDVNAYQQDGGDGQGQQVDGQGEILVLVDNMGHITGYGKIGPGGPVTGSCWASFAP